jgi:hypothetical protein
VKTATFRRFVVLFSSSFLLSLFSFAILISHNFYQLASTLMDAARISDGAYVALKSIKPSVHPYEVEIGTYLSSESLASDPKNHCVPIYEVLDVPDVDDTIILVMPLLRRYNRPHLQTFGESVDFFQQIFEVRGYVYIFFLTPLTPWSPGITIHAQSSHRTPVRDQLFELHRTQ